MIKISIYGIITCSFLCVAVSANAASSSDKRKYIPKITGKIEKNKQIRFDSDRNRYFEYDLDTKEKRAKAEAAQENRKEKIANDKELQMQMADELKKGGNQLPTTALPVITRTNPFAAQKARSKSSGGGTALRGTPLPIVK